MRAFRGGSWASIIVCAGLPHASWPATAAPTSAAAASFFAGCAVSPSKSQPTDEIRGSCRGHVFSAEALNTPNPCAAYLAGRARWIVTTCRVDGALVSAVSFNAQSGELMDRSPMAPAMAARMTGMPAPSGFQASVQAGGSAGTAGAGWQACIGVGQCRDIDLGGGAVATSRAFAHVQLTAWHYDRTAVDFKGAPFSNIGGWVTDRGYVLVQQAGAGFDQLAVSATLGMRVGGRRLVAVPAASRVLEVRLIDVAPTLAELQSRGRFEMANEAPRAAPVIAGSATAAARTNPSGDACLQDTVHATTGLNVHDPALDQACAAVSLILKNARRNGTLPGLTPGNP